MDKNGRGKGKIGRVVSASNKIIFTTLLSLAHYFLLDGNRIDKDEQHYLLSYEARESRMGAQGSRDFSPHIVVVVCYSVLTIVSL